MNRIPIRFLLILLLLASASAQAVVCQVPGSHNSIQVAANDGNCHEIQVGVGVFSGSVAISRSLSLVGAGSGATTIEGLVTATGNTTSLTFQGFLVNGGCLGSAIAASSGAKVAGFDVIAQRSAPSLCQGGIDLIFKDGFEN